MLITLKPGGGYVGVTLLKLDYRIKTSHKSLISTQSNPAWLAWEHCSSLESLSAPLFCEVPEGCTAVPIPNTYHGSSADFLCKTNRGDQ